MPRPKGPKTARPSVTMPLDVWKRFKAHTQQLRMRGEYVTASAILARLAREYLDKEETKAKQLDKFTWKEGDVVFEEPKPVKGRGVK